MASALLITFLREVEGLSLTPYDDSAGYKTIGVGHLMREEDAPVKITYAEAMKFLDNDTDEALHAVDKIVKVPLNYHQRAAVASWVFNLGEDAVRGTNTLALLNSGNYDGFAHALRQWDKETINGRKVRNEGLANRREKEIKLFLTGDWKDR